VIRIERVSRATPALVEAFRRLLPALSPRSPEPTLAYFEEIVGTETNILLIARDDAGGEIVGSVTLVLIRIPSGRRARLESVVVDPALRGRGIGESLCRAAIEAAAASGVTEIDLTSSPSREAANRLYVRLGFEHRETNVYRLQIPASPRPGGTG
jgi:ribosomal protein S18 acetylase RimI-like enzyme